MILLNNYPLKSKMWQLGICAYKLLFGHFPFIGKSIKYLYYSILYDQLPENTPDFLLKILDKDPLKRITL